MESACSLVWAAPLSEEALSVGIPRRSIPRRSPLSASVCAVVLVGGGVAWREEPAVRTEDSTALRIHTSTEVTDRELHTLMRDPQYRVGVAGQQTGDNQPVQPSFHLGPDTDWGSVPAPEARYPR